MNATETRYDELLDELLDAANAARAALVAAKAAYQWDGDYSAINAARETLHKIQREFIALKEKIMNTHITVTATRSTETRQFPAFILRGNFQCADAVGVQGGDGLWVIGIEARVYDGQGILGIGTVIDGGGQPQYWGSALPIDRGVQCASVDDAIRHAEGMLSDHYDN